MSATLSTLRHWIALLFVLTSLSSEVSASIRNDNPNASGAIIGQSEFTVGLNVAIPQRFRVKVVDRGGHPMAGITVSFFADEQLCPPLLSCNVPPSETYVISSKVQMR